MMQSQEKEKFLRLAEYWRQKATRLEVKYKKESPNLVLHVKTVYETCAEEVEDMIRELEKTSTY